MLPVDNPAELHGKVAAGPPNLALRPDCVRLASASSFAHFDDAMVEIFLTQAGGHVTSLSWPSTGWRATATR